VLRTPTCMTRGGYVSLRDTSGLTIVRPAPLGGGRGFAGKPYNFQMVIITGFPLR